MAIVQITEQSPLISCLRSARGALFYQCAVDLVSLAVVQDYYLLVGGILAVALCGALVGDDGDSGGVVVVNEFSEHNLCVVSVCRSYEVCSVSVERGCRATLHDGCITSHAVLAVHREIWGEVAVHGPCTGSEGLCLRTVHCDVRECRSIKRLAQIDDAWLVGFYHLHVGEVEACDAVALLHIAEVCKPRKLAKNSRH